MRLILSLAFASLLLAGCGSDNEPEAVEEPESTEEEALQTSREIRRQSEQSQETVEPRATTDNSERQIPRRHGKLEDEDSAYGLTMLVDGTSPQAFQDSLDMIAGETTSQQYEQLDSALRYLSTYAPEAWSGMPTLYKSLDGMTGEEIIEKAEELRQSRTGR